MREFPDAATRRPDDVTRREFLRVMAASAALAGVTGCTMRPPDHPILPYVDSPEFTPGVARHYATAMTLDGDATGLIVESHEGRPIKIEGNPAHPASLGATGAIEQAALLELYDPDRLSAVRTRGATASWSQFAAAFSPERIEQTAGQDGAGLRLLLEPDASPLVAAQLRRLRSRYPASRVAFYSPVSRHAVYDGTRLAFGRALQPQLTLQAADVIVSIDRDFLATGPFTLRYARQWADRRRLRDGDTSMSRLHVAESMLTPTGSSADARVAVRPRDVAATADALLTALEGGAVTGLPMDVAEWVRRAARDLASTRGRSVFIVGERQPAAVQAIAASVNALLDNVGRTITYTEPTWLEAGEPSHDLQRLVDELRTGDVRMLLVAGPNVVYAAPDVMDLRGALARVPHVAYLGAHANETAEHAEWTLPQAHFLESWSDVRAYDGTASIAQPLIAPLHAGRTVAEVLAMLDGDAAPSAYRLLRQSWATARADADAWWAEVLRRGVIEGTTLPTVDPGRPSDLSAMRRGIAEITAASGAGLDIVTTVGTVHDGRFANNPWLQELPHPISKLTWGNAAYMSDATASRLGVMHGHVVELAANGRKVQAPAFVLGGVATDTIVLPIGYGRIGAEHVADGVGARASGLLAGPGDDRVSGAAVRAVMTTGRHGPEPLRQPLPIAQEHGDMEGRPIALSAKLDDYLRDSDIAHQRRDLATLYRSFPLDSGRQWGMAIDLSVCTGCSACVVACQAENNIPVVGAPGVLEHREMHWLRIDRYYADAPGAPSHVVMQPMLCQHCEMAPCEYVCPVEATTHSADGLNEMIYNRCVGTRFCSNNCPYKVRRFNWIDYNADVPEVRRMAMNPDVTVRERGVMEKCTFCVQRIREAEITAHVAGRDLGRDDVVTACQQACPTKAIVFGPINDPDAEVTRLHRERRAYAVLHDLGTRPRVRYLPKITNPPEA